VACKDKVGLGAAGDGGGQMMRTLEQGMDKKK